MSGPLTPPLPTASLPGTLGSAQLQRRLGVDLDGRAHRTQPSAALMVART